MQSQLVSGRTEIGIHGPLILQIMPRSQNHSFCPFSQLILLLCFRKCWWEPRLAQWVLPGMVVDFLAPCSSRCDQQTNSIRITEELVRKAKFLSLSRIWTSIVTEPQESNKVGGSVAPLALNSAWCLLLGLHHSSLCYFCLQRLLNLKKKDLFIWKIGR